MSNSQSAQQTWDELAQSIGFSDERHMWEKLYVEEGRSIADLAHTLGYGTATLSRRMNLLGVNKRKRGGNNSPSKVYHKFFHLDQRYARIADVDEIAHVCSSSLHSIYRIRKEMS